MDHHENDAKCVPEVFADYFSSAYKDSTLYTSLTLPHLNEFGDLLNYINVDEECVELGIKKMKATLSAGHDGIPSAILKTFHDILTPILCAIFNNSLKS